MDNREPDHISEKGTEFWYDDLKRYHNDNNGCPAAIFKSGTKIWYKHGKFHNENSPAVIWCDGDKYWFIDGEEYTKEQFLQYKIKQFIDG